MQGGGLVLASAKFTYQEAVLAMRIGQKPGT
jgi:hypothetical protein